MAMRNLLVRGILAACVIMSFSQLASAQSGEASLSSVHRITVSLDDGSTVAVDNASKMSDAAVGNLALIADRSTRTGSPSTQRAKGFFATGDRIFVTDYYLAWFDYTIDDGVPLPPRWQTYSRSGSLAGLWSLDPSTRTFRYPYSSTSMSGKEDSSHNISADWPRNELIPGSDSPEGEDYWWDRYSPPIAHTIVVPLTQDSSRFELLGSEFAQKFPGSRFQMGSDGSQQSDGIHYGNQFLMTNWRQTEVEFSSLLTGETARIKSSVEYTCHEKYIDVLWRFSPSATVPVSNILVYVWVAYSAQDPETCTHFPAPAAEYGFPPPQTPYQYVSTAWNGSTAPATLFPWDTAIPCSRKNVGIGFVPSKTPLHAGSSVTIGYSPDMNFNEPRWRFVTLAEPNAGSGTDSDPIGIPFDRLGFYYENSDQTYGIGLMRGPYLKPSLWLTLEKSKWYQVHYTLSTSF